MCVFTGACVCVCMCERVCVSVWVEAVHRSSDLLLQDAPLSDCTDSIDGIDLSDNLSPARSVRKVHNC